MSEVTLVAITSAASLLTVLISRIRFILRPCSEDPEKRCQSGCTDTKLDRETHEIAVGEYELNGRNVLVITVKIKIFAFKNESACERGRRTPTPFGSVSASWQKDEVSPASFPSDRPSR